MTRHASGSIMELLLAVAEDSATLRSDMSAVYGVGGESDATDIALFFCYGHHRKAALATRAQCKHCIPLVGSSSLPTIIKSYLRQPSVETKRFGRGRSVATEPSKSRGICRLHWVSKSASDFDIIFSCGQRITFFSMWLLSTSLRV